MNGFFDSFLVEFKTPLTNPVLIFSLILFIILIFPILLKKINIPGIIGLVIPGREQDLKVFGRNKLKSFLFGIFTFALTLIIGFPVCYFFICYDFDASLLAASIFYTIIFVAYLLVSRFGVSKSLVVGGTFLIETSVYC